MNKNNNSRTVCLDDKQEQVLRVLEHGSQGLWSVLKQRKWLQVLMEWVRRIKLIIARKNNLWWLSQLYWSICKC